MNKFFKIMLPGFMTELNLPLDFCKSASSSFSPDAMITTCLGSWKIKVGKNRSRGRFYLYGAGWTKFVEKHDLHHCDCLVFEHVAFFRFHATIYVPSGCLKEFSLQTEPNSNVLPRQQSTNPTFTRILSAHSGGDFHNKPTSRLYLPSNIWKENPNVLRKNKAILKMSGLRTGARVWKANLTYYPGAKYNRFAVAEGWYEFAYDNGINKGHSCQFEIVVDASPLGYSQRTALIIVTKK